LVRWFEALSIFEALSTDDRRLFLRIFGGVHAAGAPPSKMGYSAIDMPRFRP
jgi:hypothetical protein